VAGALVSLLGCNAISDGSDIAAETDTAIVEQKLILGSENIRRESVSSTGTQLDSDCWLSASIALSQTGNILAFTELSGTTFPVTGDTNKTGYDVYAKQRGGNALSFLPGTAVTGSSSRIGRRSMDGSGRYVVATSTTSSKVSVILWDRQQSASVIESWTGSSTNVSASISRDGNYVVYINSLGQLALYDRVKKTSSVLPAGAGGQPVVPDFPAEMPPVISGDGSVIGFTTWCNKVDPSLSCRFVQVWAYDRTTNQTTLISNGTNGPGNDQSVGPDISDNGNVIAFRSNATNLGDGAIAAYPNVFTFDRSTGALVRVSRPTINGIWQPNGTASDASYSPSLSADGKRVAFLSYASNLMPGNTGPSKGDVFVLDLESKEMLRASDGTTGNSSNNNSGVPVLSADGSVICFQSLASNLVSGDTNNKGDVFCRTLSNKHNYGGHAYEFFSSEKTWAAADSACKAVNAHLVTLNSEAENSYIASMIPSNYMRAWIGLTDAGTEGNWRWVTGEPLSYTSWSAGEPNNYDGAENWAHIYQGSGMWNDLPSSWTASYVCEWDAPNGVAVQYKASNTNPTDNQISATFSIKNVGSTAIPLSELSLRYWFTPDSSASQTATCDYATLGCSKVTSSIVSVSPVKTGASAYLNVSFGSTAGSLAVNGQTGDLQFRINKSDWSNYSESDDYSYDLTKTALTDAPNVTLYRNGVLVWGIEPK
jgi:hypothetical protein